MYSHLSGCTVRRRAKPRNLRGFAAGIKAVGFFALQNYRKKKEEKNNMTGKEEQRHQQLPHCHMNHPKPTQAAQLHIRCLPLSDVVGRFSRAARLAMLALPLPSLRPGWHPHTWPVCCCSSVPRPCCLAALLPCTTWEVWQRGEWGCAALPFVLPKAVWKPPDLGIISFTWAVWCQRETYGLRWSFPTLLFTHSLPYSRHDLRLWHL